MRKAWIGWALVGAALMIAAGCSSRASAPTGAADAAPHPPSAPAATDPGPAATSPRGSGTAPRSTTTAVTPPPEQPGWTVIARTPAAIVTDERTVAGADGTSVVVARFHAGTVRYDLHVGSEDPPSGTAAIPAPAGHKVSATEAPFLLGAFNGGFKISAGAGGFEVDGQVLSPLVAGDASLVIDADGTARVGVWGRTVPRPGEAVVSVRQNLAPLVDAGQPSPAVGDIAAWGSTLGGPDVARSALGMDAAGDLLFAGSTHALPADMADALIGAGAVTAMELDINPEWVQLDLAPTPGATLQSAIPGQARPADQYVAGWTRDFVTVLANP